MPWKQFCREVPSYGIGTEASERRTREWPRGGRLPRPEAPCGQESEAQARGEASGEAVPMALHCIVARESEV